ncbi:MAG: MFS transporter [Clostridia bacterium]|nr:MFS transporter [Clostridia bacterium]
MKTALNRKYNTFVFIIIFVYMSMMFAKNIFNAEIIEIIEVFDSTATITSLVNLTYYVVYGIYQLFLVFLLERINLKNYIVVTLSASSVLTILIGVLGNMGVGMVALFIIFALNGVLQAAFYAAGVRLTVKYLSKEKYMLTTKLYSIGQVGSLSLAYLVCSAFVAISRWDIPFTIAGILFFISVITFAVLYNPTVKGILALGHVSQENTKKSADRSIISVKTKNVEIVFMVIVCVMMLASNVCFYSINNWFSKILYEVHGVPKSFSILLSVSVSISVAIATTTGITIYDKMKNMHVLAIGGFALSFVLALLLVFLYDKNVVATIILCITFISAICMAKGGYTGVTAYRIKNIIEPGKYSLITNAMASFSAGCAPTLMSFVFETFGWANSFIMVTVLCVITVVLGFAFMLFERKLIFSYNDDKLLAKAL